MSKHSLMLGLAVCCTSVLAACAAPARFGKLSGEWVVLGTQPAIGLASTPHQGEPLTVAVTSDISDGCVTDAVLHEHFGDSCANAESEAAASPVVTDELTPGPHPTPGEVRWYCDQRSVMRLVLERCAGTNSFRVTQLAWTTRAGES